MTTTANNYIANTMVPATEHCVGQKWTVVDIDAISELTAAIIMGQPFHAENILRALNFNTSVYSNSELKKESITRLTIPDGLTDKAREGHVSQRDGLLFEAISWIVATQHTSSKTLIRDPHISATDQGLDGLMIEIDDDNKINNITIFEDKCGNEPRRKFKDKILPFFLEIHTKRNNRRLISTANTLLKGHINPSQITKAAETIFDVQARNYRAGIVINDTLDNETSRCSIFKNFDDLKNLEPNNRIAGTLVIDSDLRDWFQSFAENVISKIEAM